MKQILALVCLGSLLALSQLASSAEGLSREQQVKQDLLGQITGGRERTWKWRSIEQTVAIRLKADGNIILANALLHANAKEINYYFVKLKITYEGSKIKYVGLLYIEQTTLDEGLKSVQNENLGRLPWKSIKLG